MYWCRCGAVLEQMWGSTGADVGTALCLADFLTGPSANLRLFVCARVCVRARVCVCVRVRAGVCVYVCVSAARACVCAGGWVHACSYVCVGASLCVR